MSREPRPPAAPRPGVPTSLGLLASFATVLLVVGALTPAWAGIGDQVSIAGIGPYAWQEIETQPALRLVVAGAGFGYLLLVLAAVTIGLVLLTRRSRGLLTAAVFISVLLVIGAVVVALLSAVALTSSTSRFVPGAWLFLPGVALHVAEVVVAGRIARRT